MEVSIGDYGRMIFEIMVGEKYGQMSPHWASIAAEAKPLVEQLLSLNEKMKPNSYEIIGAKDKTGKKKLSKHERIKLAQKKLWGCKAKELEDGDLFWLVDDYDIEMYVGQDSPCTVIEKTKKAVYYEIDRHQSGQLGLDTFVLKAPKEMFNTEAAEKWNKKEISDDEFSRLRIEAWDKEKELTSEEYWLKKADELGI